MNKNIEKEYLDLVIYINNKFETGDDIPHNMRVENECHELVKIIKEMQSKKINDSKNIIYFDNNVDLKLDVLDFDGSPNYLVIFEINIYGEVIFKNNIDRNDLVYLNYILCAYRIRFDEFMINYFENLNINFIFNNKKIKKILNEELNKKSNINEESIMYEVFKYKDIIINENNEIFSGFRKI